MRNKLYLVISSLLLPLPTLASPLTEFILDNDISAVREFINQNPETNLIKVNPEINKSYLGQAIELKHKRIALILAQHNNFQRENGKLLSLMSERARLLKKLEEMQVEIFESNNKSPEKTAILKEQKASLLQEIASLEDTIDSEPSASHLKQPAKGKSDESTVEHGKAPSNDDSKETLEKAFKLIESGIITRISELESQLSNIKSMLDANDELARQIFENVGDNQKPILTYETKED